MHLGHVLLNVSSPPCMFFIFIFLNKFIYLFVCFWLFWVFVAARGLSLVAASGGYSSLWCAGFSLRWLLLLRSMGSRRGGFSSCGMWAQQSWHTGLVLRGMWDLPRPGLKPASPELAGRFLTTAPPGKSLFVLFFSLVHYKIRQMFREKIKH